MAALSGEDFERLLRAILDVFSPSELKAELRTGMNLRLEWIVRDAGLEEQVAELLAYAERHRQTGCLLGKLAGARPGNAAFQELATRYPPEPTVPVRSAAELIRGAVAAFEVVPQLLADPEVRGRFGPFIDAYQKANAAIDRMHCYKQLHHCLHVLQLQEREIASACKALANNDEEASNLELYSDELERAAAEAKRLAEGLATAALERTWIHNLEQAIVKLRQAADHGDPGPGLQAQRLLRRILVRDPSRIHGLIVEQCSTIPLQDLVLSLRLLSDASRHTALHDRLRDGLTSFEDTQARLNHLVDEHAVWNNLDNSLRLALESWQAWTALDRSPRHTGAPALAAVGESASGAGRFDEEGPGADHADQLLADWADVSEKYVAVLRVAPKERRLERLNSFAQDLEKASQCQDIGVFSVKFGRFCGLALTRFVEVDESLMNLASNLTRIGDPLRAIVGIL